MIQNKKLFIITLLSGLLLSASIDVPLLILGKIPLYSLEMGLFYIGNAILGVVMYTLIYLSLKKTAIVKKVYLFSLFIGSCVFIMGIAIVLSIII